MKKSVLVAVVIGLLGLGTVPAVAQVSDETVLTYEVLSEEWDSLLLESMELTDEEMAEFRPVYEKYQAVAGNLRKQNVALITEYLAAKGVLSEDDADDLLASWLALHQERVRLEGEYARKFRRVLPASKVVRFFQIENKMRSTFMAQLAKDMPLIR